MFIFLPSQQAETNKNKATQSVNNKSRSTVTPTPTPTLIRQQTSTLNLLNECLNAAKTNKEYTLTKLLDWAKDHNQNGQYNLTGAFDSIDKQYERERQDCFAKYPQ